MLNKCLFVFLIVLLNATIALAQTCPDNIDFKEGGFNHWICQTGSISTAGAITFNGFAPLPNRQTLIPNTSKGLDFYGQFPVVAPNGSAYTLILGNAATGAQAEQVAYIYNIPADKKDYIFTYYYAVVLQLTSHAEYQRPRFAVKLTDLTTNEVVPCGTHDFVSGDGLGDFKKSVNGAVEYRDWSTVAVNLAGRQGHTIEFDFTTNDCTLGGHFGYAYLSFDDPCDPSTQTITGNTYCLGANAVTLTAPPGFGQYNWHSPGSTTILSTDRQYIISPLPADGTQYMVDAVSFSGVGQGCPASFNAIIHKAGGEFIFNLKSSVTACAINGVNLKDPALIAGSSADIVLKFFTDAQQKTVVRDPTFITQSGTYYVLGTNSYGCSDIKPIDVNLVADSTVTLTQPKPVCYPGTIDLTDPAIVGGTNPKATYGYFTDIAQKQPVANPKQISIAGTYYISITNQLGCSTIWPVSVRIIDIPKINVRTVSGCAPLDITQDAFRDGDTQGLTYTYFKDASGKVPFTTPDKITVAGTYYATGANVFGCVTPAPVPITVNLNAPAMLNIMMPNPVTYPGTVDLSTTFSAKAGYTYGYYTDSSATKLLSTYKSVNQKGTYYIKATTADGCEVTDSVTVSINPPEPGSIAVKNTFTPNGDGINDEFVPVLKGVCNVTYLKIYSRNGNLIFETKDLSEHWNGTLKGTQLPQGTYYWVFKGFDVYNNKTVTQSGSVTVVR